MSGRVSKQRKEAKEELANFNTIHRSLAVEPESLIDWLQMKLRFRQTEYLFLLCHSPQ